MMHKSQLATLAIVSAFFCGTNVVGLCQDSNPHVDLVGVAITLPDANNEYGGSAIPGRSAGVEVNLRIVDAKQFFTGLAEKNGQPVSSLKFFTEDGTELPDENSSPDLSFGWDISKDGHRVTIPFGASTVPAAGTTKLHVRGTVVLVAAKDPTTEENSFDVKKGTQLKLGNVPVKLSEIQEDQNGETGMTLTFETDKSLDTIQDVVFLDEGGKTIESSSGGGGSFGFGDKMTYSSSFNLKAKVKKITVRVKYFKSTEEAKVVVDLPVTLSLGK